MVSAQRVVQRYKEAFTIPRHFHLPKEVQNKEPIVPEGTDLAIWTWEENGIPYGIAFQAKSNKPLWHYRFRNEADRAKRIEESVKSRKLTLKYKQDKKDERKNYQHDHEVGDIFYTSWGYDQTNVDFYQVVEVKGKQLIVRKIGKAIKNEGDDNHDDQVVADKDRFVGPEIRITPGPNGAKIDGHHASKWNGKPVYQTPFGMGH